MLTIDLLVTKIYKGRIELVYASLDQENLEISGSILNLFQDHVGKTYGKVIEEIESIEEINYRLIRGLTQILERRCIIEQDSIVEPARLSPSETVYRTLFLKETSRLIPLDINCTHRDEWKTFHCFPNR